MDTILVVFHMFLAMGLVGLILIQHGKGADAGAAFGSGASATVFGASGSANFLSRATGIIALLFFITSMTLAGFAMNSARDAGLMIGESSVPAGAEVPAAPATAENTSDVPQMPVTVTESDVPAAPIPGGAEGEEPVPPVEPSE